MAFLSPVPLSPTLGTPQTVTLNRANLMTDLETANGADPYFLTTADYSKWKKVTVILRSEVGNQLKTLTFDGQSDSTADLSLTSGAREVVWNVMSAKVYDFDGGSISIDQAISPSLLNVYDFDLSFIPSTVLQSFTEVGAVLMANISNLTTYYSQRFTHGANFTLTSFDAYLKNKDGPTSNLSGGYRIDLYDSGNSLIASSDDFADLSTVSTVNAEYVSFNFPTAPSLNSGELYEMRGVYLGVLGDDWGSQDGNLQPWGSSTAGTPGEYWSIGTNDLGGGYNNAFKVWGY